MDQRTTKDRISAGMDEGNINNLEDQSFSESDKKREAEIAGLREKYGKRKHWLEIEKLLRAADVNTSFVKTTLAIEFLKDKDAGQGEKIDKDKNPDVILSELREKLSSLKLSDYRIGLTKDDLDKYDGLIDELFTKKQIKNRNFFKAFLTCDDMESIANRADCTKQYIQKLFHEKAIEFVNSEKFIAITRDIARRNRVIQEVKEEILISLSLEDLAKYGEAESAVNEDVWGRFEQGKFPTSMKGPKNMKGILMLLYPGPGI
jgi:hypothetical protein